MVKNAKLLFTDTDSLCYAMSKQDDILQRYACVKDLSYFDTSDYAKDHFLHSESQQKSGSEK